jgi:hypothetical protein
VAPGWQTPVLLGSPTSSTCMQVLGQPLAIVSSTLQLHVLGPFFLSGQVIGIPRFCACFVLTNRINSGTGPYVQQHTGSPFFSVQRVWWV